MWRLISFFLLGLAFNTAFASTLEKPRAAGYAGYTRLVFDVPTDAPYRIEALGAALRVTLTGQQTAPSTVNVGKPEISGYTLENGNGNVIATIVTPQGVSSRRGFRVAKLEPSAGQSGFRLVLDVSGAFADISPLPAVAALALQKAKGQNFTVLLDPGHGGTDTGALGNGLHEDSLNLEMAFRVRKWLEQSGVTVQLTREDNRVYSNDKRTDLSARALASRGKTLFVSIHANSIARNLWNSTYGMEVFYYDTQPRRPWFVSPAPEPQAATVTPVASLDTNYALEPSTPSTLVTPNKNGFGIWQPLEPNTAPENPSLPLLLQAPERHEASKDLAARVLLQMLGATAASSRGVQVADFYVLRYSQCPSILLEMGFVSHPIEAAQLKNANYVDRIAYGVAAGMIDYLEGMVAPL